MFKVGDIIERDSGHRIFMGSGKNPKDKAHMIANGLSESNFREGNSYLKVLDKYDTPIYRFTSEIEFYTLVKRNCVKSNKPAWF